METKNLILGTKSLKKVRRNSTMLWLMILPAILVVFLFHYTPMVGIILAFKRFRAPLGIFGSPWIGLENFNAFVRSGAIWRVTRNTVLYNLFFLAVTQTIQVIMAILISESIGKRIKKISQALMFLPYFVSFVILSAFVYGIFNYEVGALNNALKSFGLEPFNAYANPGVWPWIILLAHTWKWLGYGSVIYLAATVSIDPQLYEAAQVDGASKWRQVWSITIPGILPTVIITTLLNIGRIMRGQFELFYNLVGRNGSLFETTDVIDTFVFRSLMMNFDVGLGTAVGLYQSVFGLFMIVGVNWLINRYDRDYSLF